MKEKDLIKLVLLEKNIDHEKIKKNILSEGEISVHTIVKRPRLRGLAITGCLLLLAISAVAIPLMLSKTDKPAVPAENSVQSMESDSTDVSSDAALNHKIVYGAFNYVQMQDNDISIYYGYGTLRIDASLKIAMEKPENTDALFNVECVYNSHESEWCNRNPSSDDPDIIEFTQAYEYYTACQNELHKSHTDYESYYRDYIIKKINFNTISKDIKDNLDKEHSLEINKAFKIKYQYEWEIFDLNEDFRYEKELINAAKTDDQTRYEILNQLNIYEKSIREAIDKNYAAQKSYIKLIIKINYKFVEKYLERNGINYSEIIKKYGRLLLTKEEILSLTVSNQEKITLYLAPETPDYELIRSNNVLA